MYTPCDCYFVTSGERLRTCVCIISVKSMPFLIVKGGYDRSAIDVMFNIIPEKSIAHVESDCTTSENIDFNLAFLYAIVSFEHLNIFT